MSKRQALGRAWINQQWKPFFSHREIRRGKFKGWAEVTYLAGYNLIRKIKLTGDGLRWFST